MPGTKIIMLPLPTFACIRTAALVLAMSAPITSHAHGIAGNRFFPGTLNFDDPVKKR